MMLWYNIGIMESEKNLYVRTEDGNVYGPADLASLVSWAEDGRIEPTAFVSSDRKSWQPAQTVDALEMKWLVETEPGKVFGPFNRAVVINLFNNGNVGKTAKAYRLHEFAIDEDPPPVEKIVEKVVEKVVEKIVEVPPPARTELVVAEVIEPVATKPPRPSPESIFGDLGRDGLRSLEAAAQRELAAAQRKSGGFGIFGKRIGS